ncbi:WxL domain-containing protein [Enterococcus sp. LJL98]
MKKTVFFSSVAILLGLVVGGDVISADEVGSEETTGKVSFVQDTSQSPLRLENVSDFNFGEQKIQTGAVAYPLVADANIQVIDVRGAATGWTLSVTGSEFTGADTKSLVGAQIEFGSAGTLTGATENENTPSVVKEGFKLNYGQKTLLLGAQDGQGAGEWNYDFAENGDSVNLTIPSGTVRLKQAYTATMNWALEDVPAP